MRMLQDRSVGFPKLLPTLYKELTVRVSVCGRRKWRKRRKSFVYFSTRVTWIVPFVARPIIKRFVTRVLTFVTLFFPDWVD